MTGWALVALAGLAGGALLLWLVGQRDAAQRERVRAVLLAGREVAPEAFDPALPGDVPEVARRYFRRAIAPGTPLHSVVRLEMSGTFTLNGRDLPMMASQILSPPARGFVWQASIGRGGTRFSGSDGHLARESGAESWTKFALAGWVPLVRAGGSTDHARAAATRTMLETLWVPSMLLPQNGARWVQTGPDSAEIRFDATPDLPPMQVTLSAEGDMTEVWAMRWSDANPERIWQWQPFGGRMLDWGVAQGFRIPMRVELGNNWGTPAYAPFFRATITRVDY